MVVSWLRRVCALRVYSNNAIHHVPAALERHFKPVEHNMSNTAHQKVLDSKINICLVQFLAPIPVHAPTQLLEKVWRKLILRY